MVSFTMGLIYNRCQLKTKTKDHELRYRVAPCSVALCTYVHVLMTLIDLTYIVKKSSTGRR